jgi:hypothetical protein
VEAFAQRKSDLQDSVARLQTEVTELKAQRKATKKHIAYRELPEAAGFDRLSTQSKHLLDIIKMIAYRAHTTMERILHRKMARHDDAGSLLRGIDNTEVDILLDQQANALTIQLHPLANQPSDDGDQASLRPGQCHRNVVSRHRIAPDLQTGLGTKSLKPA